VRKAQQMLNGMKIQPPWLKGSHCLYEMVVLVACLMGDTVGHDKLCCIKITNLQNIFVACVMYPGTSWIIQNSNTNFVIPGY